MILKQDQYNLLQAWSYIFKLVMIIQLEWVNLWIVCYRLGGSDSKTDALHLQNAKY